MELETATFLERFDGEATQGDELETNEHTELEDSTHRKEYSD